MKLQRADWYRGGGIQVYRMGRCPAGRDGAVFKCGDAMHARRLLFCSREDGITWNDWLVVLVAGRSGLSCSNSVCQQVHGFPFLRFAVSAVVSVRNSVGSVAEIRSRVNVRFGIGPLREHLIAVIRAARYSQSFHAFARHHFGRTVHRCCFCGACARPSA